MKCPGCGKTVPSGQTMQLITFVGLVCPPCAARLTRATTLSGCVMSEPIADICDRTAIEFERRRETLRQQARDICQFSLTMKAGT